MRLLGSTLDLDSLFKSNQSKLQARERLSSSGKLSKVTSLTVLDTKQMTLKAIEKAAKLEPGFRIQVPHFQPAKVSSKRNGLIQAYAATTN